MGRNSVKTTDLTQVTGKLHIMVVSCTTHHGQESGENHSPAASDQQTYPYIKVVSGKPCYQESE
jgi:hypothetical protein